jgi:hypothetical protein
MAIIWRYTLRTKDGIVGRYETLVKAKGALDERIDLEKKLGHQVASQSDHRWHFQQSTVSAQIWWIQEEATGSTVPHMRID